MGDARDGPTSALSPRKITIATRITIMAVVADYLAVGIMRTLLPYYAKNMGGQTTLIGALETAYGVGQVGGALVLGKLSDRMGRRAILLLSFTGSAIGYTMAARASTPLQLILSRLPVGLAKQTVTVSRAIIADCSSEQERSSQMSRLVAAMSIGYSLGPLAGAALADYAGESTPAAAAAGMFFALIPIVWLLLPETSPEALCQKPPAGGRKGRGKGKEDAGSLLGRWDAVLPLLLLSVPELALVLHTSTTLSSFVLHHLGKGKTWLGSLSSIIAILQSVVSGLVLPWMSQGVRGWSDGALLEVAYALFAAASLVIAFMGSEQGVMISVPFAATAIAVMRSSPASYLSKLVGPTRQGEVLGLLDAFFSVCRVFGPLSIGIVVDRAGHSGAFLVQAALLVTGCVSVGAMERRRRAKAKVA